MLMSPVGLRPEKVCDRDAQQKLKTTDSTSRQRGRPTSTNPQLPKNNTRKEEKNWSRVPVWCLTPRKTGRLAVSANITLALTLTLAKDHLPRTIPVERCAITYIVIRCHTYFRL
jgi:hypothetical protein